MHFVIAVKYIWDLWFSLFNKYLIMELWTLGKCEKCLLVFSHCLLTPVFVDIRLLILRGTKLNIDYVRLLLLAKHLPYIQILQKKHCIMMNKTHLSLAFTFFKEMPFLMIKGALILHSSWFYLKKFFLGKIAFFTNLFSFEFFLIGPP